MLVKRFLAFFAVSLLFALPVRANGWEHGAIPFSALTAALEDQAEGMRYKAARSLGFRGEARAVAPLLAHLKRGEQSVAVRAAIYDALGDIADIKAVPTLTSCLVDEEREELRSDCAKALGKTGSDAALAALITAFKNDPSFLVKTRSIDALGHFSDPQAVDLLASLAGGRRNQSLARRAIIALGKTGAPRAATYLAGALERARTSADKRAIVDGLGRLKAKDAAGAIAELATSARDPRLRVSALTALGAIRDGDSLGALTDLLGDTDPAIRLLAIRSLAALGDKRATNGIAKLVMAEATDLASQTNEDLLMQADKALASLSVQLEGLRALSHLDQPAAFGAFSAAAYHRDMPLNSSIALRLAQGFYEVRRQALYGLGYTQSDAARELLSGAKGLGDPNPKIRQVSVRSLAVLGGPDAVTTLLPALSDPSADVRRMAAMVIGRLKDPAAIQPLTMALEDKNALVRREAALGLGFLNAKAATSALGEAATGDTDRHVRDAAAFALKQIGK